MGYQLYELQILVSAKKISVVIEKQSIIGILYLHPHGLVISPVVMVKKTALLSYARLADEPFCYKQSER